MKYTVNINGDELDVDGIAYGVEAGSAEGDIDLYIRIFDEKQDIYSKDVWIDWLDKCLGDKNNPGERIRPVVVKIFRGDSNDQCVRTITIQDACIASLVESSGHTEHSYEVVIKRAPRHAKETLVKVEAF